MFLLAEKRKSNRSQVAKISQTGALRYPPHSVKVKKRYLELRMVKRIVFRG